LDGRLVNAGVIARVGDAARQLVSLLDPPVEAPAFAPGGGRLATAPALWSSDR
jgi:hypothetical protein